MTGLFPGNASPTNSPILSRDNQPFTIFAIQETSLLGFEITQPFPAFSFWHAAFLDMLTERLFFSDSLLGKTSGNPDPGNRIMAESSRQFQTAGTTMLVLLSCLVGPATGAEEALDDFFEAKIRPVLIQHCLKCHGGEHVSQGLNVRSRESLIKGGDSDTALVPGDPDNSLLIQAIMPEHDELQMPPDDPLPPRVIADFRLWVKQGAVWPNAQPKIAATIEAGQHWAFQPLQPIAVLAGTDWSRHPVDRFMFQKWKQQGLVPVEQATPRALIRRVTFDLIGLPPSPKEINEYLAAVQQDREAAYGELIERLLASPHYGERWGRHWMDVARYADTAGDNADYPIPEIFKYRNYIIDAFNNDKPYDEFIREQIAGDLIAQEGPPEQYAERVVATGFLALSRRYATAPYELWHLTLEDTIDTVGRSFLGMTLRCARCHDHKFDPVKREDYYALYGIFSSTTFPWAGGEEFKSKDIDRLSFALLLPPAESAPLLERYQQEQRDLQEQMKAATDETIKGELQKKLHQLKKRGLPADLPGAYAVSDDKPVDVSIQQQGNPGSPGPTVKRGPPTFLRDTQPEVPPDQSGRRQLADWIARPENPLTARVMVNRIWQYHFGTGIVATPSNFGLRGAAPTHPQLLDYLSGQFIDSEWSIKAMHRLILSSKTYQMAVVDNASNFVADEANRYLWRFPRKRLDAEAIRDAILTASGELDLNRPGRHPFPEIHTWGWTQHDAFKEVYPSNHRSVYLMTQRLKRHPFLGLFDGPDTNTTTAQRSEAIVPPQALFMMNNPWVAEQAQKFAARMIAQSSAPAARIRLAFEIAFGRPPQDAEIAHGENYIEHYRRQSSEIGESNEQAEAEAWTSYARILLSSNEFFYVD